jgi:hypothetical protein
VSYPLRYDIYAKYDPLVRGLSRGALSDAYPLVRGLSRGALSDAYGAIPGRAFVKIAYVVSGVPERRLKTWVQPDCVATDGLDVIELADNTSQVADAVPVGIQKVLWINLIKYGRREP